MAKTIRVVSIADSALNTQELGSDLARYANSRDPELLKGRVNETEATWFTVQRLRRSVFDGFVRAAPTEAEQFARAFQFGVVKIENLVSADTEQPIAELKPDGEQRTAVGVVRFLTDEQLEHIAPLYTTEIGQLIWWRSFLPPGKRDYLVLLPSLQHVLRARLFQDVDKTLSRAHQSNEKAKASESQQTQDDGGDAHTDATATGTVTS